MYDIEITLAGYHSLCYDLNILLINIEEVNLNKATTLAATIFLLYLKNKIMAASKRFKDWNSLFSSSELYNTYYVVVPVAQYTC